MPDYPLLKRVLSQHLGFFAVLLFMATICMATGSGVFWFSHLPIRYLGILFALVGFALFIFAFVSTYSSCCYFYQREILKKHGIKTQASLIRKTDESNVKKGESLYRLRYSYQWQGENHEGEEVIEDKAIFDALQPAMSLPIVVLKRSPEISTLQMAKLKQTTEQRDASST